MFFTPLIDELEAGREEGGEPGRVDEEPETVEPSATTSAPPPQYGHLASIGNGHRNNDTTFVRMFWMADDRCELLCLDLLKAEGLRDSRLSEKEARALAENFRALGDPTRLTIALALRDGGELCVCDLAWIVERAENLVSHHVRALRAAGLADYRRDGKMALYSLTERGQSLLEVLVGQAVSS